MLTMISSLWDVRCASHVPIGMLTAASRRCTESEMIRCHAFGTWPFRQGLHAAGDLYLTFTLVWAVDVLILWGCSAQTLRLSNSIFALQTFISSQAIDIFECIVTTAFCCCYSLL